MTEQAELSHIGKAISEYLTQTNFDPALLNPHAVPTGFIDLDRLIGGLYPSDLIILGGVSTIGKTAFALSIARNASVRFNQKVGYFSLQNSLHSITPRLLAAESEVDLNRIRQGRMNEMEMRELRASAAVISAAPLFINDTQEIDMEQLRRSALKLLEDNGVDLLIVDYLQLIPRPKTPNRNEKAVNIPQAIKSLACELKVPILAISELTRAVERRYNKIPTISDLMGGRAVENAADLVMLMYRNDMYDHESERRGTVDLFVAKNRSGPTGALTLLFDARRIKFVDICLVENLKKFGIEEIFEGDHLPFGSVFEQ